MELWATFNQWLLRLDCATGASSEDVSLPKKRARAPSSSSGLGERTALLPPARRADGHFARGSVRDNGQCRAWAWALTTVWVSTSNK